MLRFLLFRSLMPAKRKRKAALDAVEPEAVDHAGSDSAAASGVAVADAAASSSSAEPASSSEKNHRKKQKLTSQDTASSASDAGAGAGAGAAHLFARDLNTDRSKQLFALLPQVSSTLSYDVVALIVSYDRAARVYSVDAAGTVCVWDVAERQYLSQQWRVELAPRPPYSSPLCVVPCGVDHRYLAVRSDRQFAVYEAVASSESGGGRSMQYELMSAQPNGRVPTGDGQRVSMVCAVSRNRLLTSNGRVCLLLLLRFWLVPYCQSFSLRFLCIQVSMWQSHVTLSVYELQSGAAALHVAEPVRSPVSPIESYHGDLPTFHRLTDSLLDTRAAIQDGASALRVLTDDLKAKQNLTVRQFREEKQRLEQKTRRHVMCDGELDGVVSSMSPRLYHAAVCAQRWIAACKTLPRHHTAFASASTSSSSSASAPEAARADGPDLSSLSAAARARFWAHFSSSPLDMAVPASARPRASAPFEDQKTLQAKWQTLKELSLAGFQQCTPPASEFVRMLPRSPVWSYLHAMLPLPAPNAHLVLCSASTGDGNVLTLFDVDCRMDCATLEAYSAATVLELQWMRAGSSDALIAVGRTAAGLCAFEVRQKRAVELVRVCFALCYVLSDRLAFICFQTDTDVEGHAWAITQITDQFPMSVSYMAVAGDSVLSVGDDRRSRQLSRTALQFGSADLTASHQSEGSSTPAASAASASSSSTNSSAANSSVHASPSSASRPKQYPARFVACDAVHRIRAGARAVPTVRSILALSDSQLVTGELVRPSSTLLFPVLTASKLSSSFRVHCGF
jgi:hypothetical protein